MNIRKVCPLLGVIAGATIVALTLLFGVTSGAAGAGTASKEDAAGPNSGIEKGAVSHGGASNVGAPRAAPRGAVPDAGGARATGTPSEGIKVHGHWLIEVRDPDGTVVTRREFDNALEPGVFLGRVLRRVFTVGYWHILLSFSNTNIFIREPNDPTPIGANDFRTLTLGGGTAGYQVVLSGSFVPAQQGTVDNVGTWQAYCDDTSTSQEVDSPVSPRDCAGTDISLPSGQQRVTWTALSSPVAAEAGQQVRVTVTLSFS